MPSILRTFFAYPAKPALVSETIDKAVAQLTSKSGVTVVTTWRETDVAGKFVAAQILQKISETEVLVADITQLNFNVAYEIGFALGRKKRVVLTRMAGVDPAPPLLAEVGLFDTLGYENYENADDLERILRSIPDPSPTINYVPGPNAASPVYLVESRVRTDAVTRIVSRIKKARLFYRSFDPRETPRLSLSEAVENVAQSFGVLLHLLPHTLADAPVHNTRVAFLAGLAEGFEKELLLLQDGEEPVPLDYRDIVGVFSSLAQIDEYVADFVFRVIAALQQSRHEDHATTPTKLEKVRFGASAAENEFRDLWAYYLETDQFQRAVRGEVRLVVGRKGSGKTAIFVQVRDSIRSQRKNVVLDLRPEGYQLLKFRELVLSVLGPAALDHTVTAFWEYLLLLEICHKVLEKDRVVHTRDRKLYEPYRRLSKLYEADSYISEGDFAERLSRLLQQIREVYERRYSDELPSTLTQQEITEILYSHDVNALREEVVEYLQQKGSVWLLFDNLDKGWPTHGIEAADIVIVRALLEATRKIERHLSKKEIECYTLVFLRNDVYELLISETPDRGKEAKVALDWSDGDLLRELLRRRLVHGALPDLPFEQLWRSVVISHVDGEESSEYLIERSLMRPRALIDLVNHCRGFAVNLKHSLIDASDIRKGVQAFSSDLVVDIGHEIRDVLPSAENVLYAFIDSPQVLTEAMVNSLLSAANIAPNDLPNIIELLLWYGVLGLRRLDGTVTYIYSPTINYEMPILKGIMTKLRQTGLVFFINEAFVPALQVRPEKS